MLEKLLPNMRVNSVYDIDLEELGARGVKGIITDLDNTLVGAKEPLATPELVKWLDKVKAAGFRVVILSNNNSLRVSSFAAPLQVPFLHKARKPIAKSFRRALNMLGLKAEETVMIGDQMLTDVLGGNRMGLYTILVTPIAPLDEGFTTLINRRIERIALSRLRKRGLWYEEETHR
ncbi:YqeG family HAD IIIA-type phosphatase [Paenibacillus sp. J5C_2022]|uniref:YqeG family HAD IIIA-type phosphatase n=1 Tax=Paenibacillus sp. J5C2022 TaxID=2977129 RepID=UPI0021CF70C0|nr:YqeG family HAD IIIA-type phosphatase [Paenibacillus sp. J5C2022]MCU6709550.1 YqeG family HAD IIIA-type phosphatase [Paenibacillus sp. J5C2022]